MGRTISLSIVSAKAAPLDAVPMNILLPKETVKKAVAFIHSLDAAPTIFWLLEDLILKVYLHASGFLI